MPIDNEDLAKHNENPQQYPIAVCEWCAQPFVKLRRWARFCGVTCRWKAWDKRNPRVSVERLKELES